ncbi:MAG: hypothetical protein QOD84_506 [Acidobacteriaceae bacterium]
MRTPLRPSLNFSIFLFLLTTCLAAFADQVVLTNGDRLTGRITKSDSKTLIIKSEFAGEVSIKWSAVKEIHSTEPLHVDLKSGQKLVGPVTTSDDNLAVTTASGTITASKDEVVDLRNDKEQLAYEKTQRPRLTEGWAGGANVGFALTHGNSQTKNLALAFTAERKALKDDLAFYANSVYASSDSGAVSATTANSIQSGAKYERDLRKRVFAFVSGDFQTDALQGLNLRSVFGGGLGFHAIKNEDTTLDLLGGLNYTRENYTTLTHNFAALTLGEEFTHKLGAGTLLAQKLYLFPNLNQAGEYRTTFTFGTVTKISKWLGWQNAFGDIYVTNPPAGKKKNDITFTTGLNVAFTH